MKNKTLEEDLDKSNGRADTREKKNRVLYELAAIWTRTPQQRLGQLIGNAIRTKHPSFLDKDIFTYFFYVEDKELLEIIEKFVEQIKQE